jgi:Methyltransferase domain
MPRQADSTVVLQSPIRQRDQLVLQCLRLIPTNVARHVLFLLRSFPSLADQWGYHIRAIHYYEPLPDFREITEARRNRRRESQTFDYNLPAQVALLRRLGDAYRREVTALAATTGGQGFDFHNDYFAGFDAALYYALIRDLKPARIIEIGSGYSTRIAYKALEQNKGDGRGGQLICIEPYPEERLTGAGLSFTLIRQRVEDIRLDLFDELEARDILFIDSSHTVKFGSDVCCEFLEILPRLKPGVWIHLHDIFIPHDYPVEWLIEKRIAFSEQYLLEAFLAFNPQFSVQAANYWLTLVNLDSVRELCPVDLMPTGPRGPASFWMRRERP